MEAAIGIKCNNFTLIATDTSIKNSYLILTRTENKFKTCGKSLICYLGDQGDSFRTINYVTERLKYEEISYDLEVDANVVSNVIQNYVHKLLRTNPRNNYFIISDESSLYSVDMYGTLHESSYVAVGIATYFCYGVLDKEYRSDMSVDEAVNLVKKCFKVLKDRCSLDYGNEEFMDIDIRVVCENGVVSV
ncbi:proteasome component [Vairimorpha apis BRL 01]|uniref:Proteasome subunit beta n=1 Tax=Vairimorpha apis BRL 01 TaxID=1037528 RepID=T0KY88_9MICR|nr:proteasome component [Vairimorpha apis BRL 01]